MEKDGKCEQISGGKAFDDDGHLACNSRMWFHVITVRGNGYISHCYAEIQHERDISFALRFLDVDHGPAAILSVGGRALVIDGGRHCDDIRTHLDDMQIREVPFIIATSPQPDHLAGLEELLRSGGYTTNEVWVPRCSSWGDYYRRFCDAANHQLGNPWHPKTGVVPEVELQVLHLDDCGQDRDRASLVFKLSVGGYSFLFTGDIHGCDLDDNEAIPDYVEMTLLALDNTPCSARLASNVLIIPNHGSATSSSQAFIDCVNPKVAILEVDAQAPPSPDALLRYKGIDVFRTDNGHHNDILCSKELRGPLTCRYVANN